MRFSWIVAAAGVCLTAAVLAACGDDSSDNNAPKKKTNVAYITYANTDYQQAHEKGLRTALDKQGGTLKTFVSNFDPSLQIKQCQDAISSGRFNAIVIEPVDGPTAVPCAQAAKAAGVPVVSLDDGVGKDSVKPTVDGVVGQVVIVEDEAIPLQVDGIKQACGGKDPCKVIGEVSTASDGATNRPLKAAEKELPNVDIVAKFATNYDPAAVVKAMPDLLAAHPDVDVYVAASDSSAVAALPALKEAGLYGKVKIVTYGGSVEGVRAVKDGDIFLELTLFPQSAGSAAAEMAMKAVNGEKIDQPGIDQIDLGDPDVVTKDNVDQFKPQWGAGS